MAPSVTPWWFTLKRGSSKPSVAAVADVAVAAALVVAVVDVFHCGSFVLVTVLHCGSFVLAAALRASLAALRAGDIVQVADDCHRGGSTILPS